MLLEASGGFWGLLETSGVRRSRRFDSWSASQSPFRQLECVAVAESACDDDRHFSKTLQFPHALKGHSPAIRANQGSLFLPSIPRAVIKAKW